MQCSRCDFQNPQFARYCGRCGEPAGPNCPNCDAVNPAVNRHCNNCSAQLQPSPDAIAAIVKPLSAPPHATPAAARVFRRQVSLVSCDLVGSTNLVQMLELEDWEFAVTRFHSVARRIIKEYGGHYGQYMGDGFMAYFGHLMANENDSRNAVLTGLSFIEEIKLFNLELRQSRGFEIHMRIGVNTGIVVVGEDNHVVGEPAHMASRVQGEAGRDALLITEQMKLLLPEGMFVYRDLGDHELRGIGTKRLYQVARGFSKGERGHASRSSGPIVGREHQLALLMEKWQRAQHRVGQAVIIAGETGIGKTKITQAFQSRIGDEASKCLRVQGESERQNTMLFPIIDHIQRVTKINPTDPDRVKLAKLEAIPWRPGDEDVAMPVIKHLLSIGDHAGDTADKSQRMRQQTLEVLCEFALRYARQGPTVFIFEGMQWYDSTTLELLEELIRQVQNESALVLMATRESHTPALQAKYFLTQLSPDPLGPGEVGELVLNITNGKPLPESVVGQIIQKSVGVPLFVEHLTKWVTKAAFMQEQEDRYELVGELEFAIPATLRELLTSRVDRAKGAETLMLAAPIGLRFSYALIAELSPLEPDALDRELQGLVADELLLKSNMPLREAMFEFKHSMIRDAAYELLTHTDRVKRHKYIAQILEQKFPETVDDEPEVVAHQWAGAREHAKAAGCWLKAGKRSAARSAHNEAIGHFEQALRQLAEVSETKERIALQADLHTALGHSLRVSQGWGVAAVGNAYRRALELYKEFGQPDRSVPALLGLWTWNFVRGAFGEAQANADELLRITANMGEPEHKVLAYQAQGFTNFARGDFTEAHTALQSAISLCDDTIGSVYFELSAQDPRVHVRLYDAMTAWFLGNPDQALQQRDEAIRVADQSQQPFSQAMALSISLRLHQMLGQPAVVAEQADVAIEFCEMHGFPHYLAMVHILRGWAKARQGEFEEGMEEIETGLDSELATGSEIYKSYALSLQADACIHSRRYPEAQAALDQALARVAQSDAERFYAAEIYRLAGEVSLKFRQDRQQAEKDYLKGLKIAREQKAGSLQLRICNSLFDLDSHQGGANRYRRELEEICRSFSTDLMTEDLAGAKARLARSV